MNQEQLNAIKQRVEKTTPGPWNIEPLAGISTNETTIWMDTDDYIQVHGCSIIQSTNDALFILRAIEDVPALITEVERLRKELAQSKIDQMDLVVDKADEKSQKREYIKTVHLVNEENKRLRKALSYYADEKHYEPYGALNTGSCDITEDEGYIARQALAGESDVQRKQDHHT
ncbi:hypothetical protein [Lysinibacillus pakistanensis]|uniref:Ead/Ea22-like family protein n=1 Tax=Lysinibacillus pakistanensis TaxID=759811 RepID=A0AAX3WYD2_9BACI|nr:hypothetical protein [Lysinibacillus pakistanensis]MDM5231444.1 hypothetical protein [Lysinibacillus pakistanensis]WHY46991.1 hypothetical protein QNH22_01885 [Lysinibacillus pakistanensis]WHY52003.1 hypothetical protein QNH24_01880 [Lysinibacillus pakistanensis]